MLGAVESHRQGDHSVDGIASGPVESPAAALLLGDGGANVSSELGVAVVDDPALHHGAVEALGGRAQAGVGLRVGDGGQAALSSSRSTAPTSAERGVEIGTGSRNTRPIG